MGLIKNFIRDGIGLDGKTLMTAVDMHTGRLASKLLNNRIDVVKNNSEFIGKVARGIGRSVLSDSIREKMSNATTKAIDFLPSGNVKDTLKSINEAAQGKSPSIETSSLGKRRRKRTFGKF